MKDEPIMAPMPMSSVFLLAPNTMAMIGTWIQEGRCPPARMLPIAPSLD